MKIDGLNLISRLVHYHPEEFHNQLHSVIVAVLNEVKNLRSSVARSAIARLGDMFEGLRQAMDKVSLLYSLIYSIGKSHPLCAMCLQYLPKWECVY